MDYSHPPQTSNCEPDFEEFLCIKMRIERTDSLHIELETEVHIVTDGEEIDNPVVLPVSLNPDDGIEQNSLTYLIGWACSKIPHCQHHVT